MFQAIDIVLVDVEESHPEAVVTIDGQALCVEGGGQPLLPQVVVDVIVLAPQALGEVIEAAHSDDLLLFVEDGEGDVGPG